MTCFIIYPRKEGSKGKAAAMFHLKIATVSTVSKAGLAFSVDELLFVGPMPTLLGADMNHNYLLSLM
jgi:hypothetical protein